MGKENEIDTIIENIKKLNLNIASYNEDIKQLNYTKADKKNKTDNQNKHIKNSHDKIDDFYKKIKSLQYTIDNKLILRLTFEFNKLSSNKLLDTFRFTP